MWGPENERDSERADARGTTPPIRGEEKRSFLWNFRSVSYSLVCRGFNACTLPYSLFS